MRSCPRCHTPMFELPGGIPYCILTRVKGHQQVTLCETVGDMREAGGTIPISISQEAWVEVLDALEVSDGEGQLQPKATELRDALKSWLEPETI